MVRDRGRLRRIATYVALLVALWVAAPPGAMPARAAGPTFYYLSLGDSLAYGLDVQQLMNELSTGTFSPASFNHGYTDLIAARLGTFASGIQVVNYGCPGASPDNFLYQPCGFGLPLHNAFTGTQMDAALAFIAAHPGAIALITLDLDVGEPEMGQLVNYCKFDPTCVQMWLPTALAYLKTRLDTLFQKLRAAAPNVMIVVNTAYNPYSTVAPWTDSVVVGGNNTLTASAQAAGLKVADMFPPFDLGVDRNATLCSLLYFCQAPLYDVHPTPQGYSVMASTMWAATGWP
jgi:lysophospholipase L1-like esterase